MSIKFGINLLLWTDDPTQEKFYPLYQQLADIGFDGVELPIINGQADNYYKLGNRLNELGLSCTATSICMPESDPISADATIRRNAVERLKFTLDCCQAVGAKILGGPLYAAIGKFSGASPTPKELKHSLEVVDLVAAYADTLGIELTLEFLNRFEIYLLNTTDATHEFIQQLKQKNVGIHYDTFHAHIEEKDPISAISKAAKAINHVHLSENDRSTPGKGQVNWQDTFQALKNVDYQGWLTIEAFGRGLPNISAATKIWRPMFEDEMTLAKEGLVFIKQKYKDVWND